MKIILNVSQMPISLCESIINKSTVAINLTKRKNFIKVYMDRKSYFVKTINAQIKRYRADRVSDEELAPTKRFIEYIAKLPEYQILFSSYYCIAHHQNYNYYVMDSIKHGDLCDMVLLADNKWVYTFLIQVLVGIYVLNHTIGLFHNDIYYKKLIKNIMIDKVDTPQVLKITLDGKQISLEIKTFCAKIIDFGRCSQVQEFRTTEYHKECFPHIRHISEPLLFTFFMFKSFHVADNEYLDTLAKSLNSIETLKEFDGKFITSIYEQYKHFL